MLSILTPNNVYKKIMIYIIIWISYSFKKLFWYILFQKYYIVCLIKNIQTHIVKLEENGYIFFTE